MILLVQPAVDKQIINVFHVNIQNSIKVEFGIILLLLLLLLLKLIVLNLSLVKVVLLSVVLVAVLLVTAQVHYARLAIISAQPAHVLAAMHLALYVQEG